MPLCVSTNKHGGDKNTGVKTINRSPCLTAQPHRDNRVEGDRHDDEQSGPRGSARAHGAGHYPWPACQWGLYDATKPMLKWDTAWRDLRDAAGLQGAPVPRPAPHELAKRAWQTTCSSRASITKGYRNSSFRNQFNDLPSHVAGFVPTLHSSYTISVFTCDRWRNPVHPEIDMEIFRPARLVTQIRRVGTGVDAHDRSVAEVNEQ